MKYAIELGLKYLNEPYKWGANNALEGGVDCSGLVCELLRTEGLVKDDEDLNAQGLHDRFVTHPVYNPTPRAGDLVFFGKDASHITHVGFMLNNYQMLEAGGGGSTITNLAAATAAHAMVRVRPWTRRSDQAALVRPPYIVLDV